MTTADGGRETMWPYENRGRKQRCERGRQRIVWKSSLERTSVCRRRSSCCRKSCPSFVPSSHRWASCLSTSTGTPINDYILSLVLGLMHISTGSWPSTLTTSKHSMQQTTTRGRVDRYCGADNTPVSLSVWRLKTYAQAVGTHLWFGRKW